MRSSVFRENPVSTVVIATIAESTTDIAKAEDIQTKFSNSLCLGNKGSRKYTKRDPAVMPNIAMAMAKKAR
jgi:hypothetical protein